MAIVDFGSLIAAGFDSGLRLGGGDWEKSVGEKTQVLPGNRENW